jgi:hypothetical protein
MMSKRTRSLLPIVALAFLTTSCSSDAVEPRVTLECLECLDSFPFAFEAISANDHPLPAFIDADGSTDSGRQLTAASMLLLAPDSLQLVLTTRHVAADGGVGAEVRDTMWARFRRQDSTVVLSPMGTYPLLLQEPASVARDGSMAITIGSPPVALVFRRTVFNGPDHD